jgi:transposase
VEATGNWMWFVDALQRSSCAVTLAHPFRTRAIASARIKTDHLDAKILCHLLRANLVPPAYMATPVETENREIARGRLHLVHDQTQLKNRIHAILAKENYRFPGKDLFGIKGRAWLADQPLPEAKGIMVQVYLDQLDSIRRAIERLDDTIKQRSGSSPQVELLRSIPGIGATTAFAIVAEVGSVERFASSRKFTAYLGMVPRLSQSGNHAYYGRITKTGNPIVRWYLVQVAHTWYRMDPGAKWFVDRLAYRAGKKKAIIALARKLAVVIYHVLKEERPYRPMIQMKQSNNQEP